MPRKTLEMIAIAIREEIESKSDQQYHQELHSLEIRAAVVSAPENSEQKELEDVPF